MELSPKWDRAGFHLFDNCIAEHVWKRKNKMLPFGMFLHIGKLQSALSFPSAAPSQRKKPGEMSIRFAIGGVTKKTESMRKIQPAAHNEACFCFVDLFQMRMRQDDSGQRVSIGQGNRRVTV
jgi:hypothetical protein